MTQEKQFIKINYFLLLVGFLLAIGAIIGITFGINALAVKKSKKPLYNYKTELYNRGNILAEFHLERDFNQTSSNVEVMVKSRIWQMATGQTTEPTSEYFTEILKLYAVDTEIKRLGLVPLFSKENTGLWNWYQTENSKSIVMKTNENHKSIPNVNKIEELLVHYIVKEKVKDKLVNKEYRYKEETFFYFEDLVKTDIEALKKTFKKDAKLEITNRFEFVLEKRSLSKSESVIQSLSENNRYEFKFGFKINKDPELLANKRHISYQLWIEEEKFVDGKVVYDVLPFYGVYGFCPNTLKKEVHDKAIVTKKYVITDEKKYTRIFGKIVYNEKGKDEEIILFSRSISDLPAIS